MNITVILIGIILGLSLAGPPGGVNAIIANESLKSKLHGASVGLGAMSADIAFFIIVYILRAYIPEILLNVIYFIGGFLMLFIAYMILNSKIPRFSRKGNYFMGLSLGLTNPFQIIWWFTVGIFMLNTLSIFSVIGLFIGILIWIFTFPYAINKFGLKYEKYIKYASMIILIIFGIYMIYSGIIRMGL